MKKVLYCILILVLFLIGTINVNADDRVMLKVTAEGDGQIKVDYVGEELHFSKNHPVQYSTHKTTIGTKYTAGAKADEGNVFIKWTLDGEDYSTKNPITITVTRNMNLNAVFQSSDTVKNKPEEKPKEDSKQDNSIFSYIGIGAIALLLIAIVIIVLKRKK